MIPQVVLLLFCITFAKTHEFTDDDVGVPLLLTPLIEQGKFQEAKEQSATNILNITGYSGFITVNKRFNSNLYFWYFPAKNGNKSAPLLIWLQGGPGADSTFGLFVENGPYTVDKDFNIFEKSVSWASEYNFVFVDSPVGAGLSFTEHDLGYANNQVDVAENLYNFLQQFYTLFSELKSVPFYLTGESYAGKYIPAIAYKIHTENIRGANFQIPLAGLSIGDGFCDPESMLPAYADLMFNAGLLNELQRDHFDSAMLKSVELIKAKDFKGAYDIFAAYILASSLNLYPTYFYNVTGGHNYDNYLTSEEPASYDYYLSYMNKTDVRKALHIGNLGRNNSKTVQQHLMEDIPDTVKPWIIELLDSGKYYFLFYNGQLDIIVGSPLTERFLWNLEWSGLETYKRAKKSQWKVNENDIEIAGYIRKAGRLTQAVVRGAGHMVPSDQPRRAFDLIKRFIQDSPLDQQTTTTATTLLTTPNEKSTTVIATTQVTTTPVPTTSTTAIPQSTRITATGEPTTLLTTATTTNAESTATIATTQVTTAVVPTTEIPETSSYSQSTSFTTTAETTTLLTTTNETTANNSVSSSPTIHMTTATSKSSTIYRYHICSAIAIHRLYKWLI